MLEFESYRSAHPIPSRSQSTAKLATIRGSVRRKAPSAFQTWQPLHLGLGADAPEERLWLMRAPEVQLSRHSTAGVAASIGDVPHLGEETVIIGVRLGDPHRRGCSLGAAVCVVPWIETIVRPALIEKVRCSLTLPLLIRILERSQGFFCAPPRTLVQSF